MKKRISALILGALIALSCICFASCSLDDKMRESTDDEANNNEYYLDNVPDVALLDGTPMVSNMAYEMASSGVVFARPTSFSKTANEGITLVATVEPSFATKKTVDWTVSFADPESTWAKGKTVTDYVTITPYEDGSLTATLECLQPFGEQIIVKVTSRENAEISDECPLEYMRRVEEVRLKVGDDITFTPGVNYVDFEVAVGNLGKGGFVSLEVDFTDVYTIESWPADSYDATDLTQWGVIAGNSDLSGRGAGASFEGIASDGKKYIGVPNMCYSEFPSTKTVYFDVDSLSDLGAYMIKDPNGTLTNLYNLDPEFITEILTDAKANGTDTIFWLEVIHPTNHRIHFEIKLGNIVNSGVIPSVIKLNKSSYDFNATQLDYMNFEE